MQKIDYEDSRVYDRELMEVCGTLYNRCYFSNCEIVGALAGFRKCTFDGCTFNGRDTIDGLLASTFYDCLVDGVETGNCKKND